MDRTTIWFGRLGAGVLVAALVALSVMLGGGVADAAVRTGYSTIDNPLGFALMAELGTLPAGAAGAGIVGSTAATGVGAASVAATGAVVSTAWSGVPIAIGGALAIGTTGVVASRFYVPKSSTSLVVSPGVPGGWVGGSNTVAPLGFGDVQFFGTVGAVTSVVVTVTQTGCVGAFADYAAASACWVSHYGSTFSNRYTVFSFAGASLYQGNLDMSYPQFLTGHNYDLQATYQKTITTNVALADYVKFYGGTPMDVVVAQWFPEWSPSYTPPQPAGLNGTLVTTVDCVGASGTRSFSTSVAAVGAGDAAPLEWPGVQCAPGETLGHFTVEWVVPGHPNAPVYDYTAPGWVTTMPVEFPGCVDGGCSVELWKIVSGAPSLYCGVAAVGCPEWWADSGKAAHFECRYGPYGAPLGLCAVFRDPGKVSPNTTVHVDPVSGEVVGSVEPIISTNPADFVDTPVVTDPVPVPNPTPPVPGPVDVPDPLPSSDSSECFPQGWGVFNPAEWVQRPVMCAMAWAFVPRPAVVQGLLQSGSDSLSSNGLLAIVPAAASVPGAVSSGVTGGCSGGLAVFGADTQWGRMEASLPCSPGAGNVTVGESYSTWYQFAAVLLVASTAWSCFIIVRGYVGGKPE